MVKLEDVKEYIRVDYTEDDFLIQSFIESAEAYIDNCVGTSYKQYDDKLKLANLLLKKIVADLYDNRSMTLDKKGGYDRISKTILDILSNCGD